MKLDWMVNGIPNKTEARGGVNSKMHIVIITRDNGLPLQNLYNKILRPLKLLTNTIIQNDSLFIITCIFF